jgi:hypothetical protein
MMDSVLRYVDGIDTKFLFGGVFVLSVLMGVILNGRKQKLKGIPVMMGYGSDHEKALMDGTLKVSSVV